ncbi:hypothetical protein CSOJ01_00255 [Colletotrichum sojae]|uniref:Uncharacterized protein n=1 Tax=Colletotrichum sojae TaxID=2175907 RepID=A0A8H6JXQ7_9PEZI|nr:hypothetical protein CSOJ01_00255 [Colletotrichum sojae]
MDAHAVEAMSAPRSTKGSMHAAALHREVLVDSGVWSHGAESAGEPQHAVDGRAQTPTIVGSIRTMYTSDQAAPDIKLVSTEIEAVIGKWASAVFSRWNTGLKNHGRPRGPGRDEDDDDNDTGSDVYGPTLPYIIGLTAFKIIRLPAVDP